MVRILGFGIVAAMVLTAVIGVSSSGGRGASASDPELVWGNWTCAADEQDIGSFLEQMRYVAELLADTGSCPEFGDQVTDLDATRLWGDSDCDGTIDDVDALLLLLWYEDLDDSITGCTPLGKVLEPAPLPEADWEADGSAYEIIGPYGTSPFGVGFSSIPVLVRADGFAHNNGPDASAAIIVSEVVVNTGNMFIRWIGQGGEGCFDPDANPVSCSEGGNNGQFEDTCLDEVDNDGDNFTDMDDSGCVAIHKLSTGIFQFPNGGGGVYDRYFTVRCLANGPVSVTIHHEVVLMSGVVDPDLSNNESSVTIESSCTVSKGTALGTSDAAGDWHSGARPSPYEPVALPQTGGRPTP